MVHNIKKRKTWKRMSKPEPVNMSKAKEAIGSTLAQLQQMIASNLTPQEQKVALMIAYSQSLGAYAMVEIRDHFLNQPRIQS